MLFKSFSYSASELFNPILYEPAGTDENLSESPFNKIVSLYCNRAFTRENRKDLKVYR